MSSKSLSSALLVLVAVLALSVVGPPHARANAAAGSSPPLTAIGGASLPLPDTQMPGSCQPVLDESYGTLSIEGSPSDPPAEQHPDLNLAMRGYEITDTSKTFVDYGPADDPYAPQLSDLFSDEHLANFRQVYRVYDWDWVNNRRGDLISTWPVTLVGLAAVPGETLHVPDSGREIGNGYEVLVLYASETRITLKYTREDNVVYGYTIHIEGVCVEPRLLDLYRSMNDAGRGELPALQARQAFGRATGSEVAVAIRDTGAFMDPRSRNDWWQGVQTPEHLYIPLVVTGAGS